MGRYTFANAVSGLIVQSVMALGAKGLDYTVDNPYQLPARSNGLNTETPNMILFMPDQLRYDSVGTFGNDACAPKSLKPR